MTEELRQREPRIEDPRFLIVVRAMPCCACGRDAPSQAAHIRMANRAYGKRETGMNEKPDDRWAVPLCGPVMYEIGPPLPGCHAEQHGQNEAAFWAKLGKDPFHIARTLYEKYGSFQSEAPRKAKRKSRPKPRKAPKAKMPKRKVKIPSRPMPKGRKFPKRRKQK